MKAVVKATGEVLEFDPKTLADLQETWQMCSDYIKAYTELKEKMKPLVEKHISDRGTSEVVNGYMFRHSSVQRMTYDKAVLRQNLDEDTLDVLLVPDKTAIDKYLKDNLEDLGEVSTVIREAMVPVGRPYSVIKAEKVT